MDLIANEGQKEHQVDRPTHFSRVKVEAHASVLVTCCCMHILIKGDCLIYHFNVIHYITEILIDILEQNSIPRKQLPLTLGRSEGRTWNGNRGVSDLSCCLAFGLFSDAFVSYHSQ